MRPDSGAHRGRPSAGSGWSHLEGVIRAFEEAWARGEAPSVRDFLRDEGQRHTLLVELVHVDMELRLKANQPVRVESYLAEFPALAADTDELLELVSAECQLRRRTGEAVGLSEYTTRFPALRHELIMRLSDTVASGPPRPGRPARATLPEVPGYEVEAELGRGGMGVVFRARDSRLGRPVALKFLPDEYAHDPERLERFLTEARTASALNHPNICTVHALGEHAGRPFLVLELIEGATLGALAGPPHAPEQLAWLIAQAARALAAAHAAGVVHRDVKPDNLMVRPDGLVKVLDFGLARRLPPLGAAAGRDTAPGEFLGTAAYCSPEQARSEPVGPASDIFSLGVVLYQLATRRHPFAAESPLGFLNAIVYHTPAPADRLAPEAGGALAALLGAMLQKDPRLRPTAGEVGRVLEALADGPARPRARPGPDPRLTVGRQAERAALRAALADAEAGQGGVLCISGDPGIGKTTLVEDFLRELAAEGRACLTARGRCVERLAGAEAYLPVLEALESLLAGEQGQSVARLMNVVAPTWYAHVGPPAARAAPAEALAASQPALKRELSGFLAEAARLAPVVLFLDDIHWADLSTADLLAHLGGAAPGARYLVVLTYRPTELLLGQHPLLRVKLELQARGVCRELPLGRLPRDEVADYLELAFPGHAFPADFADAVHARTDGGPLFMADLLGYLRDRGVIAEQEGRWRLARPLPELWPELPESARALIHRKLGHLTDDDRRLLAAASVQGPAFDAAAVAGALGWDAAATEDRLQRLDRVHRLVRQEREYELPDRTLTVRYRFVHVLYQQALYYDLTPARRAALALTLAHALDGHGAGDGPAASELATLFEAGRGFSRAAALYQRAARHAAAVFAHHEAITLASRGLGLLDSVPASPGRDALELGLRIDLGMQLQVTEGFAAPAAHRQYTRARELYGRAPEAPPLFQVLWGIWLFHKVRSELARAAELAGELRALAGRLADPALALQAQQALAVTTLCQGNPAATVRHMELAASLYDPVQHRGHSFRYGQDPAVACKAFGAFALWLIGHPDESARLSAEAVRLARELGQPSTLALALLFAAMVHQCRRDGPRALECAGECRALSTEHGLSFWQAGAAVMRGWALAACGDPDAGADGLRDGLRDWRATGSVTYLTYFQGLQAEVLARRGQAEEGLEVLRHAQHLARDSGEGLYEAELHRLSGEVLLSGRPGDDEARRRAGELFGRARDIARSQGAAGLELRAAVSLARLGDAGDARAALAEVRGRFHEGLDTPDLREASALLA